MTFEATDLNECFFEDFVEKLSLCGRGERDLLLVRKRFDDEAREVRRSGDGKMAFSLGKDGRELLSLIVAEKYKTK